MNPDAPLSAPTATSPPASRLLDALSQPRIAGLDFLRAVAVLLVLAEHSGVYRLGSFAVLDGGFGVEIFFVLSGFLITWMLFGEIDRTDGIRLGAFYQRRAARLLPAFYGYLVIGALLLLIAGKAVPWNAVMSSAFYVINYYQALNGAPSHYVSHCWSLAVEEQFYLLWPLWLLMITRLRWNPVRALLALILLSWCIRILLIFQGASDEYLYRALETRADQLAIGGLLACALRTNSGRAFFERLASLPVALFVILICLDASLIYARGTNFLKYGIGYSIEPVLIALLIPVTIIGASGTGFLRRILNAPAVNLVGQVSYGMYLIHPMIMHPVRRIAQNITGQPGVSIVISILAVILVAHLSYRWFEGPLRQRLRGN